MNVRTRLIVIGLLLVWAAQTKIAPLGFQAMPRINAEEPAAEAVDAGENALPTLVEARARARLLHETIHGALQVMHRDFFHEDEKLTIPSKSLEDVFRELARSQKVELSWLAVNTDAMNIDHNAKTEFEKEAVSILSSGEGEFEASANGLYRFAGAIRLSSQCLKCHVPHRTNTKDRAAAIVISMPLMKK